MSLKSFIAKQWASLVVSKIYKQHNNAIELQRALLQLLLDSANNTQFGKEHHFKDIIDYDEYKEQVPIASYEDIRPYIEKIKAGEKDILWPGLPIYLQKQAELVAEKNIFLSQKILFLITYMLLAMRYFIIYTKQVRQILLMAK